MGKDKEMHNDGGDKTNISNANQKIIILQSFHGIQSSKVHMYLTEAPNNIGDDVVVIAVIVICIYNDKKVPPNRFIKWLPSKASTRHQ
jgi:hypothetical protein